MPMGAAMMGGSAISGIAGMIGQRKAGKAQARGQRKAIQAQLGMYYQSRKDLAPWREAGQKGLAEFTKRVMGGPGEFVKTPQYEFLLGEGVGALEKTAGARGKMLSGEHLKGVTEYGQKFGQLGYEASLQPFAQLAGMGQAAASQQAGQSMQAGGNLSNLMLSGGSTQAGMYTNLANTISGAAASGTENYMLMNLLNQPGYQNMLNQPGGGGAPFGTMPYGPR